MSTLPPRDIIHPEVANVPAQTQPSTRSVRVFVSSTFHDMHGERDELVKRVFPELRRRCRERGIEFVGVDLRWGITSEQEARGEVLPVCLAEIDRCRPYFVGLLGERYGSAPRELPRELLERHPWLEELRGRAITELEIHHALWSAKVAAARAFFYFRDPAYVEQAPPEERAAFCETDHKRAAALEALKAAIRAGGFPRREGYRDPKEGCGLILEDLWQAIAADFPSLPQASPSEQARLEHEAFAAARRRTYVPHDPDLQRLDAHAAGEGSPLVVTGEAGSGKLALLANWIERFQRSHPDIHVIAHFTGASAGSAGPLALLRRLLQELAVLAGIEDSAPAEWHRMAEALPHLLAQAAARGPFVVLIDGLDQLEDQYHALEMAWFPQHLPPNARLIVSTLPGPALDALRARHWTIMTLEALSPNRRGQIVSHYLERQGKRLSSGQLQRIVSQEQTGNPLYLTVLMEELLVFGYFDRLNDRIGHYLRAPDTVDLYTLALERIEQDCDGLRPGLTGEAMSLLWAARRGLSEAELLACLGTMENPLPMAYWAPLRLALGDALIERSGRLTFFHDHLRRAVQRRYLGTAVVLQAAHRRLADFFEQSSPDSGDRRLDEWPYQLDKAGEWARLKDCVTQPGVFEPLVEDERIHELTAYWAKLGTRYDPATALAEARARYERQMPPPERVAHYLQEAGRFLHHCARFEPATASFEEAVDLLEAEGERQREPHADLLRHYGTFLMDWGQTAQAEPIFEQAVLAQEKVFGEDFPLTAVTLSLLAEVRRRLGKYRLAEADYRRALPKLEATLGGGHRHTATVRNNLAGLLLEMADLAGAEEQYRQALEVTERTLGRHHPNVANILSNLALTLVHQRRAAEAEPLQLRALAILTEALGADHPHTLTCEATLCYSLQQLGRAAQAESRTRSILERRERRHGPQHPETAETATYLAELLAERQEYGEAEKLYLQSLPVLETAYGPEHRVTGDAHNALARLYHLQGKRVEAESYYRRALAAFDASLGPAHLRSADARCNLAILVMDEGKLEEAGSEFRQVIAALEGTLGEAQPIYAHAVNGYGVLLRKQGKPDESEAAIKRALELYEKSLGQDDPQIAIGLKTLAELYREQGRLDEAEESLVKSLAILENSKAYGPDHPHTRAVAREPLEAVRKEKAKPREAEHAEEAPEPVAFPVGEESDLLEEGNADASESESVFVPGHEETSERVFEPSRFEDAPGYDSPIVTDAGNGGFLDGGQLGDDLEVPAFLHRREDTASGAELRSSCGESTTPEGPSAGAFASNLGPFRCSAFYPERVDTKMVGKLVACIHLETLAGAVVREAARRLDLPFDTEMKAATGAAVSLLRESVVDITPDVLGLVFDTTRASLPIWEDQQFAEFRFKATASSAGQLCRGWIHFWLEGIILADVPVSVMVETDDVPDIFRQALAQANAKPYRLVFPSYSHEDAEVVERLEAYAESFGDEYLRDVRRLRSGQRWNEELRGFIKRANVFQLFWSAQAAQSPYVKDEWQCALSERDSRPDPHFLRPVYWTEQPAVPIPAELGQIHFARVPLVGR
jgi:nephrocystin-3